MAPSPQSMQFRYSWRPYQQRVLDAIDEHLDDNRLHVVAAPGAGKTTLGLEVFRRLGKPALVLSPTRIIRDQWLERLSDFVDVDDFRELPWVSNAVDKPGYLTSVTYQALHSKFKEQLSKEPSLAEQDDVDSEPLEAEHELDISDSKGLKVDELNSFIRLLETHQIEVLILDEAHHLRAEWWRALQKVCDHFPKLTLVSLTATPPYDAEGNEWLRYEALCGPIDEEISVPELVKSGTLCAHQDYIWACNASADESQQIDEYDERVRSLCNSLFNDGKFADLVLSHPWLSDENLSPNVVNDPQVAAALLVFCKAKQLPQSERVMGWLDFTPEDIPELDRKWWQTLLEAMLFAEATTYSEAQQDYIEQLKKQLRAVELLKGRELSLQRSRRTERSLSLSSAKIDACASIHELEYQQRGDTLRQVVLVDYIRDEALQSNMDTGKLNLGAWPVFEALTKRSKVGDRIALLSGRLSLIPNERVEVLLSQLDASKVSVVPVGEGYQRVTGPLNQLTKAFTALLMSGELYVLVGTRSLLGEGWDAPVVNSLILASSVGSFMLTNQMRGRAIRINRDTKGKVSAIWHLVAINPKSYLGWSDVENLKSRFKTFVGLAETGMSIESGFERMDAKYLRPPREYEPASALIASSNKQMIARYKKSGELAERWQRALTLYDKARVYPSVKTDKVPALRGMLLNDCFKYLKTQLAVALFSVVLFTLHFVGALGALMGVVLPLVLLGVLLWKGSQTCKMVKTLMIHLPVDGALKQIGVALATALCKAGFVETPYRQLRVNVVQLDDGSFFLVLSGCSFYESSLFADCMAEILAPIDSPRYLILREGKFMGQTREDYHAVPMKFAAKKRTAQIFYKAWNEHVCLSELIYTRNQEGRARLAKAKLKAFSSVFSADVKRLERWQ